MRWNSIVWVSVVLIFYCASIARADASRISRIEHSNWIEGLYPEGNWSVKFSDNEVEYSCSDCKQPTKVKIEIIPIAESVDYQGLVARYFSDRRQYCARIVSPHNRGCTRSETLNLNWVGKGFLSEEVVNGYRNLEFILITNDPLYGRDIIKATISIAGDDKLPDRVTEFFEWNLRRLTVYW
ncbi:hypothetical protein [Kordiimonas sp. SCSIO 12610]|uniref:hypothetical protein n=1 Tax=Kordiimonas sp. SCSIO 12610 TaxID=2829597 RepID=UPI00210C0E02|nr:hypothetical protein [Kordiimonas sp. SCSIO 12610]UTW56701.1 hypothetical protein KFF44_07380 [Kordiimonas sp. SCSIO 12610]